MSDFPAVKIGQTATSEPVEWNAPRHIAVQGMTRSGKTAGMYAFLSSAYCTGRVRIIGVDPTAVLLRPYAEMGERLIHCGGADLPHAVKVLEEAVAIMDKRIASLWPARLDQFREYTPGRPVVLLVLEEAPGFMTALADDDAAEGRKTGDRLAPRAQRAVRRILAEGAKVGVLVFVAAQRLSTQVIPGDARSNLGFRITLRMDDGDGLRMLHSGLSSEDVRHLATASPGRGLVDTPTQHHARVRLLHLDYRAYLNRLETARKRAKDRRGGSSGKELRSGSAAAVKGR